MEDNIGILDEKYILIKRIGKGAFSVVYIGNRIFNPAIFYAIKTINEYDKD